MYFARGKFEPSGKGPTVLPGGSIFILSEKRALIAKASWFRHGKFSQKRQLKHCELADLNPSGFWHNRIIPRAWLDSTWETRCLESAGLAHPFSLTARYFLV
jgi:hypothetical protein